MGDGRTLTPTNYGVKLNRNGMVVLEGLTAKLDFVHSIGIAERIYDSIKHRS